MLFINFERLAIKTVRDVARIKAEVERRVRPLGHLVYAVVNYGLHDRAGGVRELQPHGDTSSRPTTST